MNVDMDYRLPENRKIGFDYYYKFTCEANDVSPDLAVEKWIADKFDFDFEKRCVMALFHGATYAGPCESMFADKFPIMTFDNISEIIKFFQTNKKRLLFSPDCRYRKMVFEKFLSSIGNSIKRHGTLGNFILFHCNTDSANTNYDRLQKACFTEWYHFKRMGFWCFAEALQRFTHISINPGDMEFATGKSHRSGWAFCIGRDDLIGDNISKKDLTMLESTAQEYLSTINFRLSGVFTLETACCNYKRQHKGSRYGGCYIDEQHTETMQMKKDWPEYDWLWDLYLEGRKAVIPHDLLFEMQKPKSEVAYLNSWNKCLKDYGRIPRIEAWHNKTSQIWDDLKNMSFAKSKSSMQNWIDGV